MAEAGAATETERELDRVWKAIDMATGRIARLERASDIASGAVRQHAPAPDYRVSEPAPVGARCGSCDQRLDAEADRDAYHAALLDAHTPPPESTPSCPSCDRPMARYAGPGAGEGGWTCVACEADVDWENEEQEGPNNVPADEPVEACSCEEAVALRRSCARLRTEAALARRDEAHHRTLWDDAREKSIALGAEVERLRADIERFSHGKLATRCAAAESRLAAANALLEECANGSRAPKLTERVRDHLAGPAAPEHEIGEFGWCHTCERSPCWQEVSHIPLRTRTEAEQRVLDACAAAGADSLDVDARTGFGWCIAVAEAELARREASR